MGGARIFLQLKIMEGTEFLFLHEEANNENQVAFGSNVPRRMFPMHTAPDRLGIEMGLRGVPHRDPGTYQSHPISFFLHELDSRPKSKKGWYFGCRTSSRSSSWNQQSAAQNPSPNEYQRIRYTFPFQCFKPFDKISPRFSANEYHTISPGPGRYKNSIGANPQIEYDETFGGSRKFRGIVRIKCTNGIAEKCNDCQVAQIGDYYENNERDKVLCPSCFNKMKSAKDPMRERNIRGFCKVRDCSNIHKHEFPGFAPKIIIKDEKEAKRLKQKEAYFRAFFTE